MASSHGILKGLRPLSGVQGQSPCPAEQKEAINMSLKERFLRYVAIDTGSSEESGLHPSTEKQWELARMLEGELREMGAENVRLSDSCYVYAEIPANVENQPAIGLIAHMDTSPDASGADIKTKIVEYTGEDICLNEEKGIFLKQSKYPGLAQHIGKHPAEHFVTRTVAQKFARVGNHPRAVIYQIHTAKIFQLALHADGVVDVQLVQQVIHPHLLGESVGAICRTALL